MVQFVCVYPLINDQSSDKMKRFHVSTSQALVTPPSISTIRVCVCVQ